MVHSDGGCHRRAMSQLKAESSLQPLPRDRRPPLISGLALEQTLLLADGPHEAREFTSDRDQRFARALAAHGQRLQSSVVETAIEN